MNQTRSHLARTKTIAAIATAMLIATVASAGVTFTSLDRTASAGTVESSNELFTLFDADLHYTEDTGGVFAPASSSASQTSLLDNATQTLTFDGSASASGGAVSSASGSTSLILGFTVSAGMPAELMINGTLTEFDGSGIDPGSEGGNGTSLLRIFHNGSMIYSNAPTSNGTISVNDQLVLATGTYELSITLSGSGPPQVGGGSGRADLTVEFIPTPGTATIALACGFLSTRRRR